MSKMNSKTRFHPSYAASFATSFNPRKVCFSINTKDVINVLWLTFIFGWLWFFYLLIYRVISEIFHCPQDPILLFCDCLVLLKDRYDPVTFWWIVFVPFFLFLSCNIFLWKNMLHITIFLWFVDENEFLCSWFEEFLLYNLQVQNKTRL